MSRCGEAPYRICVRLIMTRSSADGRKLAGPSLLYIFSLSIKTCFLQRKPSKRSGNVVNVSFVTNYFTGGVLAGGRNRPEG